MAQNLLKNPLKKHKKIEFNTSKQNTPPKERKNSDEVIVNQRVVAIKKSYVKVAYHEKLIVDSHLAPGCSNNSLVYKYNLTNDMYAISGPVDKRFEILLNNIESKMQTFLNEIKLVKNYNHTV